MGLHDLSNHCIVTQQTANQSTEAPAPRLPIDSPIVRNIISVHSFIAGTHYWMIALYASELQNLICDHSAS